MIVENADGVESDESASLDEYSQSNWGEAFEARDVDTSTHSQEMAIFAIPVSTPLGRVAMILHPAPTASPHAPPASPQQPDHNCPLCTWKGKNPRRRLAHLLAAHRRRWRRYTCNHCYATFYRPASTRAHRAACLQRSSERFCRRRALQVARNIYHAQI